MGVDLIVTNGAVLSMDDDNPRGQAVAISGKRIAHVGSNGDALKLKQSGTRVIDAQGGSIVPGFNEGHMHLFAGAAELDDLDLYGTRGFDDLARKIKAHAAAHPGSTMLIANQADYTILGEHEPVTRQHLDRILPDRPFMMFSPDHHTAWANTIALTQAHILKGKTLGPGNEIVMGGDGLANGELREGEAIDPVRHLDPRGHRSRLGSITGGEPDPRPSAHEFEDDLRIMKNGLQHCTKHGITSIQNMDGNLYTLEILAEIERRGELTARVRVPFHMKNFMAIEALDKASDMARRHQGPMLRSGFVKMFMDGVLDSWTAVMIEDYADRPGWKGEPLFSDEHFARVAIEADRRGLQIAVHAIGDGAVRSVLDGYHAAQQANGQRDSRHRIEHIEVIHPDDIQRFAAMGVVASMQPPHPPGCHGLPLEPTISRIGRARWPYSYAWRDFRKAGVPLVFASDWPVSDINPLRSIQSAMTRKKWADDLPDHRQSLVEALSGYTRESAYVEFMEQEKGQLKVGMLADVTVLSANLENTDPHAIEHVKPAVTICDGRVVHEI